LNELGVSCDTAANRGWKALSNGELVSQQSLRDTLARSREYLAKGEK